MANIFSNQPHHSIPTSLSQCTQENPTATDIRRWAAWIESIGQVLVSIIAIAGGLLTLVLFIVSIQESFFSALLMLVILAITFTVICFVTYLGYHLPALIIGALASIVQSTTVSANVALLSASQAYDTSDTSNKDAHAPVSTPKPFIRPQPKDSWVCTCGQRNDFLNQTCKNCGKYK